MQARFWQETCLGVGAEGFPCRSSRGRGRRRARGRGALSGAAGSAPVRLLGGRAGQTSSARRARGGALGGGAACDLGKGADRARKQAARSARRQRRRQHRRSDERASCVREEERAVFARRELVERLERDRLQRNRASAQPRLGLLDPSVRIRTPDMDDTGGTIDVTPFEREQLRGPEPGRGREHDHRPEERVGCTYSIFLQTDEIRYVTEFVYPTRWSPIQTTSRAR